MALAIVGFVTGFILLDAMAGDARCERAADSRPGICDSAALDAAFSATIVAVALLFPVSATTCSLFTCRFRS